MRQKIKFIEDLTSRYCRNIQTPEIKQEVKFDSEAKEINYRFSQMIRKSGDEEWFHSALRGVWEYLKMVKPDDAGALQEIKDALKEAAEKIPNPQDQQSIISLTNSAPDITSLQKIVSDLILKYEGAGALYQPLGPTPKQELPFHTTWQDQYKDLLELEKATKLKGVPAEQLQLYQRYKLMRPTWAIDLASILERTETTIDMFIKKLQKAGIPDEYLEELFSTAPDPNNPSSTEGLDDDERLQLMHVKPFEGLVAVFMSMNADDFVNQFRSKGVQWLKDIIEVKLDPGNKNESRVGFSNIVQWAEIAIFGSEKSNLRRNFQEDPAHGKYSVTWKIMVPREQGVKLQPELSPNWQLQPDYLILKLSWNWPGLDLKIDIVSTTASREREEQIINKWQPIIKSAEQQVYENILEWISTHEEELGHSTTSKPGDILTPLEPSEPTEFGKQQENLPDELKYPRFKGTSPQDEYKNLQHREKVQAVIDQLKKEGMKVSEHAVYTLIDIAQSLNGDVYSALQRVNEMGKGPKDNPNAPGPFALTYDQASHIYSLFHNMKQPPSGRILKRSTKKIAIENIMLKEGTPLEYMGVLSTLDEVLESEEMGPITVKILEEYRSGDWDAIFVFRRPGARLVSPGSYYLTMTEPIVALAKVEAQMSGNEIPGHDKMTPGTPPHQTEEDTGRLEDQELRQLHRKYDPYGGEKSCLNCGGKLISSEGIATPYCPRCNYNRY